MPVQPLAPEQLRRYCSQEHHQFETTADLEPKESIIGQPRGEQAIEFGINIMSPGYNVYVLGETGTGRTTAIRRFLREKTKEKPIPFDWVYVNNFAVPYQPRAIEFLPGQGKVFRDNISTLINCLQEDLPKAFDTEAYREAINQVRRDFTQRRDELMRALQKDAQAINLAVINTAQGFGIAPIQDGQIMEAAALQQLSMEERTTIEQHQQEMSGKLDDLLSEIYEMEDEVRKKLKQLRRDVAAAAIVHHFDSLRQTYQNHAEVILYLNEMLADVLDNIDYFRPSEEEEEAHPAEREGRRYQVNLFVDNSDASGVPVVVDPNPTYFNLMGRIEYETMQGAVTTHFTNIKSGSLHRANGGYLVMNALDLLRDPLAWVALKRALKENEIRLQSPDALLGGAVAAKSLDPEPIPLSVKIVLMGSAQLYYSLYELEEDFSELFKVKADFDSVMPRDHEHEEAYALFIANVCREEKLHHFDRSAVAKVVEYGSRLSEHQNKLSTRFGIVADLVRESSFWAGRSGRSVVTAADVLTALQERNNRNNRIQEKMQEQIQEGQTLISTDGAIVGQINGLSVIDTGDYAFGVVSRITARTYMGEGGVINIDREVDMAGPLHNKGLLTLIGYLGGTYAQNQPLTLSASLTFEQNYGNVDGDSASSTELYALLSSISDIPLKQSVAVTGSVNQKGEVQPIGGATEKIEGFFAICRQRGFSGQQGCIIPTTNAANLNLSEEVVIAVREGQFHIWPIRTIDEGIELLTDLPAGERAPDGTYPEGTVHRAVQKRLLALAQDLKAFGHDHEDEEE